MWLLDTNAWIAYLERKPNPIKTRIAQTPENQIVMCDIVKAELLYGAYKSTRVEQNLAKLEHWLSHCRLRARRLCSLVKSALILHKKAHLSVLMIYKLRRRLGRKV